MEKVFVVIFLNPHSGMSSGNDFFPKQMASTSIKHVQLADEGNPK